ncbi:DUF4365 domain-containing protein [Pseudomonas sp. C6002]|uniref:DUF4365 domain-containing protein n=1 Tax=Pseudomonas sp. C6002 TaxID=2738814 RepID=UPI0015A3F6F9|nr:DUF4365 domain-containing protein [Pseudomonas sp. C6002]
MDLPKRVEQHVSEKRSLTIIKDTLPESWVVREISERDYGVDLYVEIVEDDGLLRGDMIAIQLKSTKELKFKDGRIVLRGVKRSTLNYWLSLPVPVFVIMVCLKTRYSFWANIDSLNRQGAFAGKTKTVIVNIRRYDGCSIRGTQRFVYEYQKEKNWTIIENAIEKSLMLYNTLGPLVLMCRRKHDSERSSTTIQYLVNQHYEYFRILAKYLLGKDTEPIDIWYKKNHEHCKETKIESSPTLYMKIMKNMLSYMLRNYRDCIIVAYELVTQDQAHYFSERFPNLCTHLKYRPHTFLAEDWYARFHFDEYESETQFPELLYFKDFDELDDILPDIINT